MGRVFLDILIVLVAAKVAAELAERINIPTVVGEIVAGILIGPSVLALVHKADHSGGGVSVLQTLGEIGVILLLFEVGMHMDLRELRAVGRSAMSVAVIGVVVPFAAGYGVAQLFGLNSNQSLFVSAALAATSVGITARVFGDLRALATVEARTVLGAAVADDVIGLVILTIVVRIATGSVAVTASSVAGVIALAIAFLVVTTAIGSWIGPKLFEAIDRVAKSSGTLLALALAFTLGISQLASVANLAPIVGAFVAGLALGRSSSAPRIQRELTPVGHLFIPVFFLQIGIDTDVAQFAKPAVLGLAGALIVVAILGKVVAGLGATGTPSNRLLIGIGMIPRGEVGLIFAGVGLREGILQGNAYASILMMVLVTTLMTPPLLTWQMKRVQKSRLANLIEVQSAPRPDDGWTFVTSDGPRAVLSLAAHPGPEDLLPVSLEAAEQLTAVDPTSELLDWVATSASSQTAGLRWDHTCTEQFIGLLREDSPRAWRFLETTGVLGAALPELRDAMHSRRVDVSALDAAGMFSFPTISRLRAFEEHRHDHSWDVSASAELARLRDPDRLYLAAFLVDATRELPNATGVVDTTLARLALSDSDRSSITRLVSDQQLLRAAAGRPDGCDEDSVLRIAVHLGDQEQARAQYVLSMAMNSLIGFEAELLIELNRLMSRSLSGPTLSEPSKVSLMDRTRDSAIALVNSPYLADRIVAAPLSYLLVEDAASIARHVALLHPLPARGKFRVGVHNEGDVWRIEIGARDQTGLLALVTGVLEEAQLDVIDAGLATWGDGAALQAFRVRTDVIGLAPDPAAIERALTNAISRELVAAAVPDAVITFDDVASPWHTLAEVRATDRRGLLHALAVAFAAGGADVHAARITTSDFMALDRFDLTDRNGTKLSESTKAAIRDALNHGVHVRPLAQRLFLRTNRVGTIRKQ